MRTKFVTHTLVFFGFVAAVGCGNPAEARREKAETGSGATAATVTSGVDKAASATPSSVARLVFVGQKDACPCTRKRVDDSWAVLQKALEKWKNVEIKKIQLDVEVDEADKLDDMKTLMVPPGLYFFDKKDALIEMLQGELKESQITAVLGK